MGYVLFESLDEYKKAFAELIDKCDLDTMDHIMRFMLKRIYKITY